MALHYCVRVAFRRDATKDNVSSPWGIAPAKDMQAWMAPSTQRYSTGTRDADRRSAYTFASSRSGSHPALTISAGGSPDRSGDAIGDARWSCISRAMSLRYSDRNHSMSRVDRKYSPFPNSARDSYIGVMTGSRRSTVG